MSVSPLDSAMWAGLYGSALARETLSDWTLVAAMIRVEIALAEACEAAGLTPAGSGARIADALRGVEVPPEALAEDAARDGVPVPALLAELRGRLGPAEADALHWGATSQDIVDTATVLCLGAFAERLAAQTDDLLDALAEMALEEAETVQLARTRTQGAVPTTFGATVAVWGIGLAEARERVAEAGRRVGAVSLYGAAGTDAALGEAAGHVRAEIGRRLGLVVEDASWHTRRSRMADFGAAVAGLAAQAGRMGADVAFLASSGIGEVRLSGGGSSAMPHKANPVRAEAAQALARHAAHLLGAVTEAAIHGLQRDGAAWGLEWLSLAPLCGASAAALENVAEVVAGLSVEREAIAKNLAAAGSGPFSERLVYLIAAKRSRAEARQAVDRAFTEKDPQAVLREEFPDLDWTAAICPSAAAGSAPGQALAFAASRQKLQ